jgi:hypothetical protein
MPEGALSTEVRTLVIPYKGSIDVYKEFGRGIPELMGVTGFDMILPSRNAK